MKRILCVLIGLVGWLGPATALATTAPPAPAIPEPSSALLFVAGAAVTAIPIRMIRRK